MPILILSVVAAIIFCLADAMMIPLVMRPLFKASLGTQMLDELRLLPAALFYVVHISGLVWFAGIPALRGHAGAFTNGALLGLVAYSCYEMTSYTIMRDWNVGLVVTDMIWGTLISGLSIWGGVSAARNFSRS